MNIPKLGSWATETLYPAGPNPWNSTQTKTAPVGDLITPDTKPGAQWFNYLLNQLFAQDIAIAAAAFGAALDNWQPPVTATSIDSGTNFELNTICWDAAALTWNAHLYNGSSAGELVQSQTNGRSWAARSGGTVNNSVDTMCAHAGVLVYHAGSTVSRLSVAGSITNTTIPDTSSRNTGTSWWSAADSVYYLYLVNNNSGASYTLGTLVSTPDGVTLTQHTAPTNFVSATENLGQVLSAQSPGLAIVAICGNTAGTDTSRLAKVSALAMTDITPSILTGKIVLGLGYDAGASVFLLTAYDGTNTTLYSSPDATTWTLASTFTGQRAGTGVCSAYGAWALSLPSANTVGVGGTATYQVWLSTDQGATWHQTYNDPQLATSPSVVQSSGTSLMLAISSEAQVTSAVGLTG